MVDFIIPSSQKCLSWVRVGENPFEFDEHAKLPISTTKDLAPNTVLLEVYAVGLNPSDYKLSRKNFAHHNLPSTVGHDVSGIIRVIGTGTDQKYEFREGDAVCGHLNLSRSGALQQYTIADINRLVIKPKEIQHVDAASLGTAFLSAWIALIRVKEELNAGELIYVPGGSGGIASYAVQIAHLWGGKVITTASKKLSIHLLKSQLNAEYVFNYKEVDVKQEILNITKSKGVKLIFDCTYKQESLELSSSCLAQNGKFVVLGHELLAENSKEAQNIDKISGQLIHVDLGYYSMSEHLADQFENDCTPALKQGINWLKDGKIKPQISKVITLNHVAQELDEMAKGHKLYGRIICEIHDPAQ